MESRIQTTYKDVSINRRVLTRGILSKEIVFFLNLFLENCIASSGKVLSPLGHPTQKPTVRHAHTSEKACSTAKMGK